jgi:hypothetical protein
VKLVKHALTSFGRVPRQAAYLVLFVASIVALVAPACSSNDVGTNAAQLQMCSLNSECDQKKGLICAIGRCRPRCMSSVDCSGGDCVTDTVTGNAVCQPLAEKNKPCESQNDCAPPLACASDYRCRNLCQNDMTCNTLGTMGRVCAQDANGIHYCANPPEVSNGMINVAPPPGAVIKDGGPPPPMLDGSSDSGSGPNGDGTTPQGDTGSSSDDGSDAPAMSVCTPACGVGQQCVGGMCQACGKVMGGPCCGTFCDPNLSCSNGKCMCGTPGLPCCGGSTCNGGVTCTSAGVCACGAAGQACCPASSGGDAAQSACTSTLQCAGVNCTCTIGCSGGLVQRSDGSLWNGTTPVTGANGSLFLATSFSAYSTGTVCAAKSDGSAWCWGSNSYGQLGNNTTTSSPSLPVQVLTGAGTPLTNVKKVAMDAYNGYTACALDGSGSAWCWGYGSSGQLGNGGTGNSSVAVPVLTQSGGAQLTGVADIVVGYDHVCARMTDKSAFCWGSNSYGQVGVGVPPMTTMQFLYPQALTSLQMHVVSISVGSQVSCVATDTGDVYCWGNNTNGVLGNGLTSGIAIVPAQVTLAPDAGGAALSGVAEVQLLYYGYGVCALKAADRSIWCWGSYPSPSRYSPTAYTEQNFAISNVFVLCPNVLSGDPAFIDAKGAYHYGGSAPTPLMCP